MKSLLLSEIDRWRITVPRLEKMWGEYPTDKGGAFEIPSPNSVVALRVIAANDEGWDHVSVSTETRCPTWTEMDWIKRVFFHDHEVVMQLHVATKDHLSHHPYCLHLWRPWEMDIPLPPAEMVAPQGLVTHADRNRTVK